MSNKPNIKEWYSPQNYKGLLNGKTGKPLSDLEYMLVLAERADELRSQGVDPELKYNRNVLEVAEILKKNRDAGASNSELAKYLTRCIEV